MQKGPNSSIVYSKQENIKKHNLEVVNLMQKNYENFNDANFNGKVQYDTVADNNDTNSNKNPQQNLGNVNNNFYGNLSNILPLLNMMLNKQEKTFSPNDFKSLPGFNNININRINDIMNLINLFNKNNTDKPKKDEKKEEISISSLKRIDFD